MRGAEVRSNDRLGGGRAVKLGPRKGDVLVHARRICRCAGGRRQLMEVRVVGAGVVHLRGGQKACGARGGRLRSEAGRRAGAIILTWDGRVPLFCPSAVYLNSLGMSF